MTFKASRLKSWAEAEALWGPFAPDQRPTPFQDAAWIRAWYAAKTRHCPEVEPVVVDVVDERTGELALLLPLVRLHGRPSSIEFADCSLTDYNLPILGPAAPQDRDGAVAALAAVRKVLPPADLAVFTKMPAEVAGRKNPLVLALPVEPSNLSGNVVATDDDYRAWMRSLSKHDRKELERIWRVFTREPDARFVRAATVEEGLAILGFIEAVQSERMRGLGRDYLLDDPEVVELYRGLVRTGLPTGQVVITALMAGEETVAGLFCIADERRYCMLRFAFADGWSNASPGKLIIERTINAGHADGYRIFDFTIGDYRYKRDYGTVSVPLFNAKVALSLMGLPWIGIERAKAFVKQRPTLERVVRRVLNKAA